MSELNDDAWCETGCTVDMYHGETDTNTQKAILAEFTGENSTIRCVIATVSFGLGVEVLYLLTSYCYVCLEM